jgi:hypothetical protein
MSTPQNANLDFNNMASKATLACSLWRAWALAQPKDCAQARRAFEVAALFEKQADLFAAMHRNRIAWQPAATGLTLPPAQPARQPATPPNPARVKDVTKPWGGNIARPKDATK